MGGNKKTLLHLIGELWFRVGKKRRNQFKWLTLLMFLTSIAEVVGIGAVIPFIGFITAPDNILNSPTFSPILLDLGINTSDNILLAMIIIFITASLISALMRLSLLRATTRLSFAVGADLSYAIFRTALYQTYSEHCNQNSSHLISGIANQVDRVNGTLLSLLGLITSVVIMAVILGALVLFSPIMTISIFTGMSLIYGTILILTRKKLEIDSESIALGSQKSIKVLQEAMGGIRDVIIDGSQEIYCQNYSKIELPFRRAQANGIFLAASPRICIEALAMIFIASAAFFFSKEPGGIGQAIPTLAAIALAAQRLLPIFQQAYSSFIGIKNNEASLRSLLSLLNKSTSNLIEQPKFRGGIPFDNEISFNSVGFKYHDKLDFVFKDINFTIRKGSRIGLMGASGSGKSTLLDILMGLLQPTQGSLEVDGVKIADENRTAWQSNIAHVPQSIFLTDSSIEENIAFGVPKDKINHPLLWEVARQAQLQETIEKLPNQYQTLVGERGVFLSGGQRQRIGIARALYKRADVIIFDEATSALDNETERHVMNSIDSLSKDLTIIICAHRKATLTGCDQIIELNGGNIFYA